MTATIRTRGNKFVDEQGRTLLLRGVNLGGSSKVPYPDGATWQAAGLFDHRQVSFVGRPFPLAEADTHFTRLKAWGFTFLRFLVTWEAIEHAGPGMYDEVYLDYLAAVISKAAEYDIQVFIDPHQDAWSRFSGGDGAPGWTFEAVGMDIRRFKDTGAAIVHATHGDPLPPMIWPTNYGKLANLTMWTLFFGGNDFAPRTQVEGIPAQEYLQGHYIEAIRQVALRVQGLPNVTGFDTLNEPSAGMIGIGNLHQATGMLLKGEAPTPFQAMLLGAGHSQQVELWDLKRLRIRKVGQRQVNPDGVSVWRDGVQPIWRQNGVWDLDDQGRPVLLRPDHFIRVGGREVDFFRDYFRPFVQRYTVAIRSVIPRALIFTEMLPNERPARWPLEETTGTVHAPHWYDFFTLFTKFFQRWIVLEKRSLKFVWGLKGVKRSFSRQLAGIIRETEDHMGIIPTLIGEIGIPFDMAHKRAFRTGDFTMQETAMDAVMHALETNRVSFTLWNYTADNTNARGDQWNDEDLSLFSRDQQTGSQAGDIHDGGRALRAAIRPYARKIAGEPLRMAFDIKRRVFKFAFTHDDRVPAATEVFIPAYQYPSGYRVKVSDGDYEIDDLNQTLIYRHSREQLTHWLVVEGQ